MHNRYEYFDLAIFRSRPHMTLAVGGPLNPKSTKNEAPKLLEPLIVSKLGTEN